MTILLAPKKGSRHKKKRIGRGNSSGHGTYATRGIKGELSRTGGPKAPGFEGGQTPLLRRIPKRHGFKNPNRVKTQIITVEDLNTLPSGSVISVTTLLEHGMINNTAQPIKILGDGDCTKPLTIQDLKLSENAKKKIEAAGGSIEATHALDKTISEQT